jgi:hypothetical protein
VTFEPGSHVSQIEEDAFCNCSSLVSLFVPSEDEELNGLAFAGAGFRELLAADGNSHMKVEATFLLDLQVFQSIDILDGDNGDGRQSDRGIGSQLFREMRSSVECNVCG